MVLWRQPQSATLHLSVVGQHLSWRLGQLVLGR